MILPDVNVLLYAFRRDAEQHDNYRSCLEHVVNGGGTYGISPQGWRRLFASAVVSQFG